MNENNENRTTETGTGTLTIVNENKSVFAVSEAGTGELIRTTTTTETETLFNAVNGASEKLVDYIGKVVEVVNIVVTSADVAKDFSEREKEDAEKVNKPVVHFFTADNKHITSISNGIVRGVQNLLACSIIPTEDAPINLNL